MPMLDDDLLDADVLDAAVTGMETAPKLVTPVTANRAAVEWEQVTHETEEYTERLPVPGGWIYCRTVVSSVRGDQLSTLAMVFVPTAPESLRGAVDAQP